ncbi:SDR family oxidoreductase [Rhizobium ruizarguesonis]|jgi:NAD(P)-dependent dehydrogenase (short-subunit alcohol dehydrogenase family)|uniref:SDR family oxidoreductase n=1 Tax=Rhizobium ruizarguesonis TaxID=2081791 RepID=UPI0010319E1C|nr:SDR family oxidoreductase [Rhizobium ruizarguesonis]MBY5856014.1 SDR family oxidoreductase [Rhizobium leguminosarum]MBY5891590.1 SDR family oxidoreductase [Rhizobium leguminosarum]QSZ01443.1 SDR family oxidoreductase [Rhizobium ruizarguesonis]TAZ81862.1 SDR family oxidoreductase [Rhizobium ruizarguesonis]TBC07710.1 SDR family oxidoreductase [Rhizobium ruizarguesonis]
MSETTKPVALITGGGRGMGEAIARELSAQGYQLALMSPSESCERLAAELGGVASRGVAEKAEDLKAIFDLTMKTYGRIDAVVNLSGHPPKGDLLEISDENWTLGSDMMILSLVRMARLVTPVMLEQGKGAFVNITTFAAYEPTLVFPVSCTYRAAAGAFTKLYSDRYAADNIRMNCILPGYIDSLNHKPGTAETVPMKRIGHVEEIAKTAAFLLSEGAGYITGQNIRVDGGVTRHV